MAFARYFFTSLFCVFALFACDPPTPAVMDTPEPSKTIAEEPPLDSFDIESIKDAYENTDRVVWQRPNLILALLGEGQLDGKTVADIGCGPGFFAKRLAMQAAKVIALDIDQTFLDLIDSTKVLELPAAYQGRLETRLTPPDRPALEVNEVDAVLIVNTFMFIQNKQEYLEKLRTSIKEGGQLVIVDFKRKRTTIGPKPRSHRTPLFEVEDLLHEAGYQNIRAIDTELNYQYILIADK